LSKLLSGRVALDGSGVVEVVEVEVVVVVVVVVVEVYPAAALRRWGLPSQSTRERITQRSGWWSRSFQMSGRPHFVRGGSPFHVSVHWPACASPLRDR